MSENPVAEEDPAAELAAADRECREAQEAIDAVGEDRLVRLADVHDRLVALLDRYDEAAAGSGRETFQSYVDFQGELSEFEADIPEDVPERDALEAVCERLDRRRLTESDFERAREELAPVDSLRDRLAAREAARRRYRNARRRVTERIDEIDAEIEELESTLAFDDVDLDVSVSPLQDPIQSYNDAVDEAFREFVRDAPSRHVLSVLETTRLYPLVDAQPPPSDLRQHLAEHPVGEEPIGTVLEYAEYSRSKLSHYVRDPGPFRAAVAGNRTYLDRLDAAPFHIDWPPPPRGSLRFRTRELVAIVDRFAPDSVLARLHAVRDLRSDPAYDRLREVARAREALDETARERLRSGAVAEELAALREERERLRNALEDYPERAPPG